MLGGSGRPWADVAAALTPSETRADPDLRPKPLGRRPWQEEAPNSPHRGRAPGASHERRPSLRPHPPLVSSHYPSQGRLPQVRGSRSLRGPFAAPGVCGKGTHFERKVLAPLPLSRGVGVVEGLPRRSFSHGVGPLGGPVFQCLGKTSPHSRHDSRPACGAESGDRRTTAFPWTILDPRVRPHD